MYAKYSNYMVQLFILRVQICYIAAHLNRHNKVERI